jgi:hypothetical protein
MPHDPIGDNRSHVFIRVMDALPAAELQSESDRAGNVARVGGGELLIVGHYPTIPDGRERRKERKAQLTLRKATPWIVTQIIVKQSRLV